MKLARIGDIALFIRNGKSIKQSDVLGGLPITRIETIADGTINSSKVGFAGLSLEGNEDWVLEEGDILISHINSTKHLAKCAQYNGSPKVLIHGMNLLNLRCDRSKAFPRYVMHYLKSKHFLKQIPRITKDSVNQSSFTVTAFKELTIYLPPLPEQKRIAAILDKAEAIRRKRERAIELTDSFLRSVFLEMFGDPVQNPKGWTVISGEELFAELRYGTSEKCHDEKENEALPVLRIPNILGERVSWENLKFLTLTDKERSKLLLKPGDILFVRSNGNPNYIARCAVFEGNGPTLFASYLIRGRLVEKYKYRSPFLRDVMSYPSFRSRLLRIARTTAGNYNMSTEGLRSLQFIAPPPEVQDKYLSVAQQVCTIREKFLASKIKTNQLEAGLAATLLHPNCETFTHPVLSGTKEDHALQL